MTDTDALEHMGWLKYEPVQPVRPSFQGEVVYNEHWQALVRKPPLDQHIDVDPEAPNALLANILRAVPEMLSERHATVATSFVIWLGTACGRALVMRGREIALQQNRCLEASYGVAWYRENIRSLGTNGGYRSIEHLLAPADHWRSTASFNWGAGGDLVRMPQLSLCDYEVVEQMAEWLGTGVGQAFINEAEREIELRRYVRPPAVPMLGREITS